MRNTTSRRSFILSFASIGLAASAGCAGKVKDPQTITVQNSTDAYEIARIDSWTAGDVWEYKSTLIIDGDLTNQTDTQREIPTIQAEIDTQTGTAGLDAQFSEDNQWKQRSNLTSSVLERGESINFRVFYSPESQTQIRRVTLAVT